MSSEGKIFPFSNPQVSLSQDDTISIGKKFAADLEMNSITGLFGNLGSGKTQFVKGVCEFFGVKSGVSSPTFTIVNEYAGFDSSGNPVVINHFDLYRLKNLIELKEIGIESYIRKNSICLIEWAQLADEYLSGQLNKINFEFGADKNERIISFFPWFNS